MSLYTYSHAVPMCGAIMSAFHCANTVGCKSVGMYSDNKMKLAGMAAPCPPPSPRACMLIYTARPASTGQEELFSYALQVSFINLGGVTSRKLNTCSTHACIITAIVRPDLSHVSVGHHCRSDPVQVQSCCVTAWGNGDSFSPCK